MSQRGAQEAVEPLTDGVSNSICSRSAGGGSAFMPMSNLPSCSLVTEEMLGLLIRAADRRSINVLRAKAAVHFSFSLLIFHKCISCRRQLFTIQ